MAAGELPADGQACIPYPASQLSQGSSSNLGAAQQPHRARRRKIEGQVLMVVTALIWGSNPLALRFLYLSPGPPSSAVLAAAQTVLAAFILLALRCACDTYSCCGTAHAKAVRHCTSGPSRVAAVWENALLRVCCMVLLGRCTLPRLCCNAGTNVTTAKSRHLRRAPCLPPSQTEALQLGAASLCTLLFASQPGAVASSQLGCCFTHSSFFCHPARGLAPSKLGCCSSHCTLPAFQPGAAPHHNAP